MTKDEALKMAIEALEAWDGTIEYQYTGTREAMSYLTHIAQKTPAIINACKEALEQPACPECGGNGAGGEHEEDCSRLQLAQEAGEENEILKMMLKSYAEEALEDISGWGAYAGDYFQGKWGLQEDLDKWKHRIELSVEQKIKNVSEAIEHARKEKNT